MNEQPTPETDALRKAIYGGADAEAEMTSLASKLERERDEWAERWADLARTCIKDICAMERERDEARGAIKSTIAWLKERRNAPDFTTMGMVEERLLKALGAAK